MKCEGFPVGSIKSTREMQDIFDMSTEDGLTYPYWVASVNGSMKQFDARPFDVVRPDIIETGKAKDIFYFSHKKCAEDFIKNKAKI